MSNTPCVVFSGYRQRDGSGYGERTVSGVRWLAHRYAWFSQNGPIPSGLFVCHRCNNKGCVNVDHLYLADNRQNCLDAIRDGLWRPSNSKKKACPKCNGEYTRLKSGGRVCLACRRVLNRKYAARSKEQA